MNKQIYNMEEIYFTGFDCKDYSADFSWVGKFNGHKFKVTSECGNCYYYFRVYVQTPSLEWALVATDFDIATVKCISYISDEDLKETTCYFNLNAAKNYIATVFA